jgi:hypothetical protein
MPELERSGSIGFLEAIGERAAFFGDPVAGFECWMWPIEVFRGMRVEMFRSGDSTRIDSSELELHATVSPSGFVLQWRGENLAFEMEVFAARSERGIVIRFRNPGPTPLQLELVLRPIFRPMWPAGMGGQIARREPRTGLLVLSEELGRFAAVLGSPRGCSIGAFEERGSDADDLRIGFQSPARIGVPFLVAGAEVDPGELSASARLGGEQAACGASRAERAIEEALALWHRLTTHSPELLEEQCEHWRSFLAGTAHLSSSDAELDQAFEWSKIAIERAWTRVDGIGRSVVAGVGSSRGSARPGFAWFFGGDALAATRAQCAVGDFAGARELLRFVASTQREDGKIAHEITLSANLCDWRRDYPYAYYKGQVTPGFVSCLAHYWKASGDGALVRELWPTALRALEWCRGTLGAEGRMRVPRAGIAAVEAGPLSGRVEAEVFLEGIHISALAGARMLVQALELEEGGLDLQLREKRARAAFEAFWCEREGRYGFALLEDGGACEDLTAYVGLPLSRGCGEDTRALSSAMQLSRPELCTDWGARMFSNLSPIYAADHYNIGSVFPYLTNFVTLALYQHGLSASAHQLLESQVALCGFDGAGFVPEHLEGDRARSPARGVPHQVFSSGGLLQSIVYGMFGIEPFASEAVLVIRSDLPRDWERAKIEGFCLGESRLDLELLRAPQGSSTRLALRATLVDGPACFLIWWPRMAPLSRVPGSAIVAGESVEIETRTRASGAVEAQIPPVDLAGEIVLDLVVEEGPLVRLPGKTIDRGNPSQQVRMGEVRAGESSVEWQLFGLEGVTARLPFHSDRPVRVEGALLEGDELVVRFPERAEGSALAAFTERVVSIELSAP